MLFAGECIGHAGVQMGQWTVHVVGVVQVSMHGHLGRPASEEAGPWMVPTQLELLLSADEVARAESTTTLAE